MIELTRSPTSMALAATAALALVVDRILTLIAFAILSGPGQLTTADNLLTAGLWIGALGAAAAFVGVATLVWPMVLRERLAEAWELAGAAVATLLIAIGFIDSAASSPGGSESANILAAIGFGGWAILCTVRAARRSLLEQSQPTFARQAALWLGAAGGLLLIAVATGLPNASTEDKGLALATALLWMVGLAMLGTMVWEARHRTMVGARRAYETATGLAALVIGYAVLAIVAGVVFGPYASLTGIRAGVPIGLAIEAVGLAVLGLAAWNRIRDLTVPAPVPSPTVTASCGHPLPEGAHFCPQCGAPAVFVPPVERERVVEEIVIETRTEPPDLP